jgi:signal peptidase I
MNHSTVTRTASAAIAAAAIAILLSLAGCNISGHAYKVAGDSMSPMLHPGDLIFADLSKNARTNLHDGEVILLHHNDAIVIKRILAMPGETISGDFRKVYRNGNLLGEPYLAPPSTTELPWMISFPPRTLGASEIFVMGDNRDNSLDSRAADYGPVKLSDVVGKYSWIYWHATKPAK